MMQIQGVMLDLAPGKPPKSSNGPATTSDSPVQFEQLLAKLRGSTKTVVQEGGPGERPKLQALAQEEQDDWANLSLGALTALLAQPVGLEMVRPELAGQGEEAGTAEMQGISTAIGYRLHAQSSTGVEMVPAFETLDPEMDSQRLSMEESVTATSGEPEAEGVSSEQSEASPELETLAKLLQELQVDATFSRAEAKGLAQPKGWGQLERYWLLRSNEAPAGEGEPLTSAQQGEAAEGLKPPVPVGEIPSLRAIAAQRLTKPERPVDSEVLASSDNQKVNSQLAFSLDLVGANGPAIEAAGAPEISFRARPGMPLQQQLEQGLAVGVRQLRVLRSEEGMTVRMQLYPESLGEVRVELKLEGNVLTAQLRTFQPQAAEALRLELPILRESLQNQGFAQVFLGAETAPHFDQSSGQRQQRFQEEHQRRLQRVGIVRAEEPLEEPEVMSLSNRLDYRL